MVCAGELKSAYFDRNHSFLKIFASNSFTEVSLIDISDGSHQLTYGTMLRYPSQISINEYARRTALDCRHR
jgi:hypothetical protein